MTEEGKRRRRAKDDLRSCGKWKGAAARDVVERRSGRWLPIPDLFREQVRASLLMVCKELELKEEPDRRKLHAYPP